MHGGYSNYDSDLTSLDRTHRSDHYIEKMWKELESLDLFYKFRCLLFPLGKKHWF
ncbi:unnamed protein product [Arabidopsis thaliana]|uniref:Uncharacterized protein n=1 Tax=Arabidopsis thaliana TaxID=3702 RepID=Q9LUR7_ARATH|nr:unnamed protein product [Arabidopsis thaliana]